MDWCRLLSSNASSSLLPPSLSLSPHLASTTLSLSSDLPFLRSCCHRSKLFKLEKNQFCEGRRTFSIGQGLIAGKLGNWEIGRGGIAAVKAGVSSTSFSVMAGVSKLKKDENLRVFESPNDLSKDLAQFIAQLADEAVKKRGTFSVVLSGGSLINALGKLIEPPYVESIDWSRWHVFWVDERVVPKTHPDSNYKLAYDGLLSKVPVPPGQVYAINDALPAEGAAQDYEAVLKQLVKQGVLEALVDGYPRFDLLLLGMGPDGHVASLFPGHPLVDEKEKWIAHILDSPKPPPERITFTFPVINAAANIVFVATGSAKANMMEKVFGEEAPHGSLPSQEVFPTHGKLIWFADKTAAFKLCK